MLSPYFCFPVRRDGEAYGVREIGMLSPYFPLFLERLQPPRKSILPI